MLRSPQSQHWRFAMMLPLLSLGLLAQSERGTITGSIHDSSGAVIVGAKVTVNNTKTGVTVSLTSNDAGEFTAAGIDKPPAVDPLESPVVL